MQSEEALAASLASMPHCPVCSAYLTHVGAPCPYGEHNGTTGTQYAEESLMADDTVYLADGRSVPKVCVEALDDLERTWPGSSFPRARAAIVWHVLNAAPKGSARTGKHTIKVEED